MDTLAVTGTIRWQGHPKLTARTRLTVRLLDVTEADRPSQVVAEITLDPMRSISIAPDTGELGVPFALTPEFVDPRRRYVVAAHLYLHAEGKVIPGDQITTQSYPVLTMGHAMRVEIILREV
jgi:uncharacterized lipoprotein YbaY